MRFLSDLRIDPGRRETDVDEDTDDFSGGGEDRIALRLLGLLEEALTIRPELAAKLRRARNSAEVAREPTYPDESRMRLTRSVVRSLDEQISDLLGSLNESERERVAAIAELPSGWLPPAKGS
jgi:hypothetical protein